MIKTLKLVQKMTEIKDIFHLSNITRYSNLSTNHKQSVSDHSFNVSILTLYLYQWLELTEEQMSLKDCLVWAIIHDVPECETGDILQPMKQANPTIKSLLKGVESKTYHRLGLPDENLFKQEVKLLVKMADELDVILFCQIENELGNHQLDDVIERATKSFIDYCEKLFIILEK